MPTYITENELRGCVSNSQERYQMRVKAASKVQKDTFLSHSSKDNDLVPGAILVLERHGAGVYVDLGDERLPTVPAIETAQILRDTLRQMRRFVLLVTQNSRESNWIPWELGLADGQKNLRSVAIFPIIKTQTRWAEQEYLGLYPHIVWGPLQGYSKEVYMVYDHHTNTATELSDWLR